MITKSWFSRYWQWKIGGCVALVGALSVGVSEKVLAQIVPDNTLGAESSVVTPNVNIQGIPSERIDGGATRGANLFHSFQDFNVGEGRGAYFANPTGIENILTRVTGSNASNIFGRLGVLGGANLFLLNPNGIAFGANASLDIQGSFVATTAERIQLGDSGYFSAAQPQTSSLLSVSPGALFFSQVANQPTAIINQGNLSTGKHLTLSAGNLDLQGQLRAGGDLTLLAQDGTILVNGGEIDSQNYGTGEGGDINITAMAGSIFLRDGAQLNASTVGQGNAGNVNINARDTVSFDGIVTFNSSGAPIGNGGIRSTVEARAVGDGGDINIMAGSVSVTGGARILTRNDGGQGNAGRVKIKATDTVTIAGFERTLTPTVGTDVAGGGIGNGDDVNITARSVFIKDEALVAASIINGKGENGRPAQAGNVTIRATDTVSVSNNSVVFSEVGEFSVGNGGTINIDAPKVVLENGASLNTQIRQGGSGSGGDINITTGSLSVTGGSQLFSTSGRGGNAGNITIKASDRVSFDGVGSNRFGRNVFMDGDDIDSSAAYSTVEAGAVGKGGDINIMAGSVSVTGGARILARNNNGQGNAGRVTIKATDTVTIAGFERNLTPTVGTDVAGGGIGNGDDVNITARSVFIKDEALVAASIINGKGENERPAQAGNVTIRATDTVSVSNNSVVFSEVGGSSDGNGGTINIDAPKVVLENGASLNTQIRQRGSGSGGDINITTGSLSVTGGSQLFASTSGGGKAGNITIKASDSVSFDGVGSNRFGRNVFMDGNDIDSSAAYSTVEAGAVGNGGDINITAPSVILSGNSQLSVETSGAGRGGNLTIETQRLTIQDGTRVSASTSSPNPEGVGGNLTINATESFNLTNQARLLAQSNSTAHAGNIKVETGQLTASNGSIETSATQSTAGTISITAADIHLFGDSDITTSVFSGTGNGGNIDLLEADSIIAFYDSDILAYAQDGKGGRINFDTPAFFGENYRPAPRNTDPVTLDDNNRVDVNANAAVRGVIITPDTTFIQNSLTELPENQINTDTLLATSCIVRRNQPTRGSFTTTGTGGLPQRPGDVQMSSFPTVDVETLPSDSTPSTTNPNRPWQKGDPIVEPQGVYRLPNGKLVLSRECS